jgi:GTP-binding protein Era
MTFKSGFVAIVGQPNVGKSTLLNAILGERLAAVTQKPQTTRHKILGIYNDDDAQIVFLDTPGYHRSGKPLNRVMNEIVDEVIGDADVVCLMVDASANDHGVERSLFERIGADRCLVIANKADELMRDQFDERSKLFRDAWGAREMLFISALKEEGISTLIEVLKERLPNGEPFYPTDIYTNHSVRFVAAEIIREEVFLQMHQEIPYSAAVEIEDFREPREQGEVTRIVATIIVEKASQKGMVIGKGGERIKTIGMKSREKIEKLVDGKVFLDLRVKVVKDWTKDIDSIKKLGYATQLE